MATERAQRVKDVFDDADGFRALLEDAEGGASREHEMRLVGDLKQKFDQWGMAMYLSSKQLGELERIAAL